MKIRFVVIAFLMALLGFAAAEFTAPTPSYAQASNLKIAVLDIGRIMEQSKAAKSVKTQIDAQRSSYQKEIKAQEDSLRAAEKTLIAEREKLSPEAFVEKRQEFEKKVAQTQSKVQERKRALDESFNQGMQSIRDAILKIVGEMSDAEKIDVVLPASQIVAADKKLDITTTVLTKLDQALPEVKIKK